MISLILVDGCGILQVCFVQHLLAFPGYTGVAVACALGGTSVVPTRPVEVLGSGRVARLTIRGSWTPFNKEKPSCNQQ